MMLNNYSYNYRFPKLPFKKLLTYTCIISNEQQLNSSAFNITCLSRVIYTIQGQGQGHVIIYYVSTLMSECAVTSERRVFVILIIIVKIANSNVIPTLRGFRWYPYFLRSS